MTDRGIAGLYRDSMRRHRLGYALYSPAPFSRLKPGMLGYLDEYQLWHPILDLTDASAVAAGGYAPLGHLQPSEPDARRYGPLTSTNVSETSVDLEAAAAVGLPVDVGGVLQYSTSGGFGAVLMCDSEVVSEGFDFRDPFAVWLRRHAKVLFGRYPDAKKHGVCAVTWTYSATEIHITAWEGRENKVTVGFEVGAAGVGTVGPKVGWVRGRSSSGWSSWRELKRVVFFTGVKIQPGMFGGVKEKREEHWRGDDEEFFVEDEEGGGGYRVGIELFGDDWYRICEDEDGDREE